MDEKQALDKAYIVRRAIDKESLKLTNSIGVGDTECDIAFLESSRSPSVSTPMRSFSRMRKRGMEGLRGAQRCYLYDMKYLWALVLLIVVVYVGYEYFRIQNLIQVSAGLVAEVRPYENATGTVSVLVLGDSTAVGVGSPSDESVAGRLGEYLHASVENHAVSGAVTADLPGQIAKAQKQHYDLILIQIGANDIIRFHSPATTCSSSTLL